MSELKIKDYEVIDDSEIKKNKSDVLDDRQLTLNERVKRAEDKLKNGYTMYNIRPVVKWFLNHPNSREAKLKAYGCKQLSYERVFCPIFDLDHEHYYSGMYIYYGTLMHYAEHQKKDNHLIIKLISKKYCANGVQRNYEVIVDQTGWKKGQISMLNDELTNIKTAAKKAMEKNNNKRAHIFFLGKSSQHEPNRFIVNNHRLIFAILTDSTNNLHPYKLEDIKKYHPAILMREKIIHHKPEINSKNNIELSDNKKRNKDHTAKQKPIDRLTVNKKPTNSEMTGKTDSLKKRGGFFRKFIISIFPW